MAEKNELRVSIMRNFSFSHVSVSSVEKAKLLIRKLISKDLRDTSITDNSFDLEIYEDNGDGFDWFTWYNSDTGNDICEEIEEEEAKS